jgi:hypothetical protein
MSDVITRRGPESWYSDEYLRIFDGLNDAERRWVEVYVRTGKMDGDTYPSRLSDPWVVRAKNKLKAFYSRYVGLETEHLLGALKAAAYHDPVQIFKDGVIQDVEEWPLEIRECIQEIDQTSWLDKDGVPRKRTKVKFVSRLQAQKLLGDYLKLWAPEVRQGQQYQLVIHMHPEPESPDPALVAKPVQRIEGGGVTIELPPDDGEEEDL